MSDSVITIGGKNILLSRALKYFDDQDRCQRKLSLTPKEYNLLLDKIIESHDKQLTAQNPHFQAKEKESKPKKIKPPQPIQQKTQKPQVQVQVQVQQQMPQSMKQQYQPPTPQTVPEYFQQTAFTTQPTTSIQKPQWYDMLAGSKTAGDVQQLNNNSALLERRFFNTNPTPTPMTFSDVPPTQAAGSAVISNRTFDLINPSIPIMSRNPSNSRRDATS